MSTPRKSHALSTSLEDSTEADEASTSTPADISGELLSALDMSVIAIIPNRENHTLVLQDKTLVTTIKVDGSLQVQYTVLADDLNSRTQLVREARSHELSKRRQDLALAQEDLQRLELKLRQEPVEDDNENVERHLGEDVVRLNQLIGNHARHIARLERPELDVKYTEIAQTASFTLPPGLLVRVPALFSFGPLLWCPLQEPRLTICSRIKVAKVKRAETLWPTATFPLPRAGRAGALCVSAGGVLYVDDNTKTTNLYSFDTNDHDKQRLFSYFFCEPPVKAVTGLACCQERVYLTDPNVHGLVAMWATGEGLASVAHQSLGAPYGLCASDDLVFATDRQHNRVRVLRPGTATTTSGQWIQEWGRTGAAPGEFNSPGGLAYCQSKSWVLVADTLNHRVQAFLPNGTFVMQWGVTNVPLGRLNQPLAVACCRGLVFVSDSPGKPRIQAFTLEGHWVQVCRNAAVGLVTTPALAAHGDQLFVSGYEDGRVHAFRVGADGLCAGLETSVLKS